MTKKQRLKKMHAAAWSPAARRKRAATMAAKRAAGIEPVNRRRLAPTGSEAELRDVMVFLEHAERAILKSGGKRITAAESYAMLALTTLRGN